jgi:CheY-like chemotaxis protein
VGIDSQPQADRTEVDRLLHQLRSTLARLKAEVELLRLDGRPPDGAIADTLEQVFVNLGRVESAMQSGMPNAVIVIDDDHRLSSAMSRQLQRHGLHCSAVDSVERLANWLPPGTKLVIDLSALRVASRSSIERIRSHPMVAMSGSSDPLAREEARMYGARDYLIKPVDVDHLLRTLDSLS